MINLLKTLTNRAAHPSASPRESISAGHGFHRPISVPALPAILPSDRRGRLKNGNRPGDFLAAPRCGARTRCGGECRQPAMKNGRRRLHGGLSTGPRTPEGLARSRRARLTHGGYSAHVRALRTAARAHNRRVRALAALIRSRSAGHGVHRSNSATASGTTAEKIHHRGHRGHREAVLPVARAARIPPSSVPSVSSVVNPSSAGHGLHRSFSNPAPSTSIRVHLRSSAASIPFSAGHGLHRPILDTRPALR
jgi:hypothetical protein